MNTYNIFVHNGYPENVVERTVELKVRSFKTPFVFEPYLCPIY